MKSIRAQFNKLNGPDATSSYKIEFTIDESQRAQLTQILELKKHTEVLLNMYVTGEDDEEMHELITENEDDTKTRLNRRMHALMSEIATNSGKNKEDIKKILKEYLIKKECIVKSSSELDIRGFALAIYYLENEFDI